MLPYPQFDVNRIKLAMKIGDKYRLQQIGLRQWRKLAIELGLEEDALIGGLVRVAREIPDHLAGIGREAREAGLEHAIIDRLITRLSGRSRLCAKQLGKSAS